MLLLKTHSLRTTELKNGFGIYNSILNRFGIYDNIFILIRWGTPLSVAVNTNSHVTVMWMFSCSWSYISHLKDNTITRYNLPHAKILRIFILLNGKPIVTRNWNRHNIAVLTCKLDKPCWCMNASIFLVQP